MGGSERGSKINHTCDGQQLGGVHEGNTHR